MAFEKTKVSPPMFRNMAAMVLALGFVTWL